MADYFTPGLERVARWFRSVSHGQPGRSSFPPPWSPDDFERKAEDETLREYFERVVDDGLDEELERNAIEESALVLISLSCNDDTLQQLTVEGFVTRGPPLLDAYLADSPPQYLRFDYDPRAPGPLFKEPQPHLHVEPSGEPRLGVSCPEERSLLAAFFDVLYRNYFQDKWMEWVDDQWERIARRTQDWNLGHLETIAETYSRGNLTALREQHGTEFRALKTAVSEELNDFFPEPRRDPDELSFVNL
jgi:hypothetical protein